MSFFETLREFFPRHSSEVINKTIDYVESGEGADDPEDFKLDRMVSLMLDEPEESDSSLDEAFGYQPNSPRSELLKQLLEYFPDACPKYMERIIETEVLDLAGWITNLSINGYEKRKNDLDLDRIHRRLVDLLPRVDPSHLLKEAKTLLGKPEEIFTEYVNDMLDKTDYPSIEDYNKRRAAEKEVHKYTDKFVIDDFLDEIPDPLKYFQDPTRLHSLLPKNPPDETFNDQIDYALAVLYNHFNYLHSNDVKKHMSHYKNDVVQVAEKLERLQKAFKTNKSRKELPICNFSNKRLLQELAYVQKRNEIRRYINFKNEAYKKAYEEAKKFNLLATCENCFNDELLPEECYFCMGNCIFCKECVKRGSETVIGDGNMVFPCFAKCDQNFSMRTLEMVLDPVVYFRLEQRKQIEDLKNANLNDFMTCQFCCDYVAQQDPNSKIFVCRNDACLKETCLECGHESHIPQRCNEIEYDEDVKMRTYIENKMTEALLRSCPCGKKIIKEGGCNKMTCNCGKTMCYMCGMSNITYDHFGVTPKCALYVDLNQLHTNNVVQGALKAKRDLGVDVNPNKLKFDPTRGLNDI